MTDTSEYGVPTTSTPAKYGWLGAEQQPTELPSGVVAMGVRSYVPQLGRFLQPDPVPGGSANAYTYTFGDPVNASDPSGALTYGFSGWLHEANDQEAQQVAAREVAREALEREEAERRASEAAEAAAAAQAAGSQAAETPLGGSAGWAEEYALETEPSEGGGDPIARAAAPCADGDDPRSNHCGAQLPGRALCSNPLLQGCRVTNHAPKGTRTGKLKVLNPDGGIVGCAIGGVIGGYFAAEASAGLAVEAGATGGCFVGGSIVIIIEEL
jgi:RHS repeat-associated protein